VSDESRSVAFVGLGRMGRAMAGCVIDHGFEVALFDPAPVEFDALVDRVPGRVRVATSPADAASTADVIDVVVNTDAQALDALLGVDGVFSGARSGTVVLVHSTIGHDTLRELARAGDAAGVHVLDASISGSLGERSVGDLVLMVGGDAASFATAEPVLQTYGGMVLHLGPLGAGLDMKLALNLIRYLTYLASHEAVRLATEAGIDADTLRTIVQYVGASNMVGDFSRNRVAEDHPRCTNNWETARKDLGAAVARGRELDVDLSTAEFAIDQMHRLWALDESGRDRSSL